MNVTPLYPPAAGTLPLEGLYLRKRLPASLLYSNFVTSLDGRIAVARPGRVSHEVPKEIANPRDWRLYQELAAQSDVLITSARFFRQTQINEAQDVLPLGPEYTDLRQWRTEQGLTEQPDLAIVSGSLELPLEALVRVARIRRVWVLTGTPAPPARKTALCDAGIEVIEAGHGARVEGGPLRRALETLGAKRMYAVAGPQLLHALLADRVLDRLYLTLAGRLLGGTEFDTLCLGPALEPVPKLHLTNLYFDPEAPADAGQLLATYDLDYA
ncbi:MAG: RibD family protein [Gammaproteobacteria bacterium]